MGALHPLLEAAVAALLLVGAAFVLIGAIGLVRFRDFYMRLHAPTKASTLGVGGVLAASLALRELLIALFLFVTAPVSAHLMAQAALHLRVRSTAPPPDDLDRDRASR
jgi:multicomponent K+:H+ antiporter subunit G